ncbi:MAG: hypothetical protein V4516_03020, partial [Pseudomonadota bacterium]
MMQAGSISSVLLSPPAGMAVRLVLFWLFSMIVVLGLIMAQSASARAGLDVPMAKADQVSAWSAGTQGMTPACHAGLTCT